MTLNPTLKSILVRTAYIVGSLTIYYIAYNYCLDYLDFHYWSDGGLIDGHPTLRYTLLMMAAAILIWVNIRKLSRPNIRLYFSAFLLGLGLLIGAWKVGAFYLYSEHVLLRHIDLEILFHFGWFSVLISSIFPIFFVKQKNAKLDRGSKIGLLIVVLLFDFTIAMPNIFGDEIMEARIYGNENCYLIQNGEEWSCHLLSVTNPDDKIWTDSVVMRTIQYFPKDNSWWVADNGDSIRIESTKVYHSNLQIIHSNGKSYQVRTLGYAETEYGNCWQSNIWHKIKGLFCKEENER